MGRIRMKRACDVPIAAMTPVDGGHHCPECDKTVYDLRRATREEAEALFARSDATPCVRILPDAQGFAVLRRSRAAAAGVALFAAGALGCSESPAGSTDHEAHPGEEHAEHHTEEFGLAGEPMMVEDPAPPPDPDGPSVPEE